MSSYSYAKKGSSTSSRVQMLVGLALLTAVVVVLQLLGSFIKIGPFSISLVLIPIVVGAGIYGPIGGAYLGGVFGLVVTIACINGTDTGGYVLFSSNPIVTILLCMGKGILAGLASGYVYKLISKWNQYVAIIVSAIICPIVNTGIFILIMITCFKDTLTIWANGQDIIYYAIIGLTGINFILELGINLLVSPGLYTLFKTIKKK